MTEINELAQQLGKAINQSPQAAKLRAARAALEADKPAVAALKEYQTQADKIARLEDENKPIEVEDKHKLQELHDKLVALDVFKNFTSAQVDYIDVMRKVNDALRKQLAETELD